MMATTNGDKFTSRIFEAINGMLLDMLAADPIDLNLSLGDKNNLSMKTG